MPAFVLRAGDTVLDKTVKVPQRQTQASKQIREVPVMKSTVSEINGFEGESGQRELQT